MTLKTLPWRGGVYFPTLNLGGFVIYFSHQNTAEVTENASAKPNLQTSPVSTLLLSLFEPRHLLRTSSIVSWNRRDHSEQRLDVRREGSLDQSARSWPARGPQPCEGADSNLAEIFWVWPGAAQSPGWPTEWWKTNVYYRAPLKFGVEQQCCDNT